MMTTFFQAEISHRTGCGCEVGPKRETREEAEQDIDEVIATAGSDGDPTTACVREWDEEDEQAVTVD